MVYFYDFRTTITLVYYGLSLTSVEFSGNKYLNFMLVNAVEVPAFLTSWYFMEHFSRRKTQAFSFLFSGIGCIMVNVVPTGKQPLSFKQFFFPTLISKYLRVFSVIQYTIVVHLASSKKILSYNNVYKFKLILWINNYNSPLF